jgi:hypothetical protein
MGIPQNRWFRMEHPIKMNDLGGTPMTQEISIRKPFGNVDHHEL